MGVEIRSASGHPGQMKHCVLTAAFERLISDRALRRRLGEAGRAWAKRNSWRHSADLLFSPTGNTHTPF